MPNSQRKFVRVNPNRGGDENIIYARMTENDSWIQITVRTSSEAENFANAIEQDGAARKAYIDNAEHIRDNPMPPPAWTPGNIEQAIGRSQRRTLRDIILEVIKESTGTRSNQFIVDVMSYIRDNNLEINTENLVVEIDTCINDGLIMEIDYTVPESNWRIRSLLLPKDSQIINIANGSSDGKVFVPLTVAQFAMLKEARDGGNINRHPELITALFTAVQKIDVVLATRDLPNDTVKGIV